MKRSAFLIHFCFFLTLASPGLAQTPTPQQLEQNEFDTDILNQWWSYEDKVTKGECDMRIFVVKPSEFEFNCVNWANGFSGGKCAYTITIKNDFFELKAKDCKTGNNPGFIYGYLSDAKLFLLISVRQLSPGPGILSEKNWYKFEKIKR